MNGLYVRLALVWLVSVSAGCTSAPVRYHTLTPTPDKTWPGSQTTLAIEVRVIHTPPQLNRSELMVRTGQTEVTLLENERWASPLKDEITGAVHLELQRRVASMGGLPASFTRLTLEIDVQRLEAELGRYALLDATWRATLSTADQPSKVARAASCSFQADERIATGFAGIVEGYQREIAALAVAVVAVLTSLADGSDASCH